MAPGAMEPRPAGAGRVPFASEEAEAAARLRLLPRSGVKIGYAARPGSGPAGETCASCRHLARRHVESARVFRKCALMRDHWTDGIGSDVELSAPACRRWRARRPSEEG